MMYNEKKLMELAESYLEEIKNTPAGKSKVSMETTTIELLARNNHNQWCEAKKADGYVWGPVVDDEKKTSDRLVPWKELCEEAKEASRENARETLRLLAEAGFNPVPVADIVTQIAESLHDSWVRNKLAAGYTYGPIRNDDETKGPKTHRDMLPFDVLMELYPEDAAYDIDTAKGVVDQMMNLGFAFAAA